MIATSPISMNQSSVQTFGLFTDADEFDHVFSFNGFLGFTKTSMAVLFYCVAVQMVEGVWYVGCRMA